MSDLNQGVRKLDEHIAEVRKTQSYADQLGADTEVFGRYLGGLIKARELVTGIKQDDDAATQAEAS